MEDSKIDIDFQALFASIVDSTDDAILSKTLGGIITSWNKGAEKVFGYTSKEAIGKHISILISPDLQDEETDIVEKVKQGQHVEHYETQRIRKDGKVIHVSLTISPIKDSSGNVIGASKISRDITRRKEAEAELEAKISYAEKRANELSEVLLKFTLLDFSQHVKISEKGDEWDAIAVGLNTLSEELQSSIQELKKSEERYRTLYDSIDEGYCIIEMIFDENKKPVDYRFLEINAAFERQTGLSNAVGKRMREFAPNHEDHWFEMYGKIALTGESARFQNQAEQLQRWYDVYAFRFGDPKNLQVAILFNDISERRKAEEQLRAVNKELESFSYSVSHDLRAPLRAVNGYAQMLNEDYGTQLDSEGKRIIDTIRYNATKMGTLIDDLLSFSRLGRKEVLKTNVNMNELIEGVLLDLNKSVSHKAKIKVAKLHNIKADYGLINQVMFNLVSNAVKYSSKKEDPVVEIASEEKNGEIIFSVKDNGAGFDMKYSDKLFGVFQRLHTQDDFEGTGVGLAIIQRIIAKHGGKIWGEGKVNEGATFYFTLPKE